MPIKLKTSLFNAFNTNADGELTMDEYLESMKVLLQLHCRAQSSSGATLDLFVASDTQSDSPNQVNKVFANFLVDLFGGESFCLSVSKFKMR